MHKKLLHLCVFVELWCIFLGLGDRPLHPRLLQVLLRLLDVGCNLVLFPLQNTHQLTILSKIFPSCETMSRLTYIKISTTIATTKGTIRDHDVPSQYQQKQ